MALPFPNYRRLAFFALGICLSIFSVRSSESFGFKKVGAWPGYARGTPKDLDIMANTAYIAMGEGGICIVDITSRTNPVLRSRLDLPGDARTVKVANGIAYVSCGNAGLQIVNVANPAAPIVIGSFKTDGPAVSVAVSPSILYVADATNGVVTLNISDPRNPNVLGRIALPGATYDVAAETETFSNITTHVTTTNRYMQVANGTNGVLAYRVVNPATPTRTAEYRVAPGKSVQCLGVSGRYFYYVSGNFLISVEYRIFSDSGTFLTSAFTPPITKIAVLNGDQNFGLVYLFQNSQSYRVPFRPFGDVTPVLSQNAEVSAAFPGDGFSYFLDLDRGLTIYGTNGLAGSLPIGGEASRIRLGGSRIYVGDNIEGLRIFTEQPDGSVLLQSQYNVGATTAFDIANSNLFLVAARTNVQILDVTNINQPRLLTNISTLITNKPTGLAATDLAWSEQTLYYAGRLFPLTSIDVSDPSQPKFIKAAQINRYTPYSMNIIGDKIFAAENAGFVSLQVNADKTASVLQYVADSSIPRGLQVAGNLAFLCSRSNGLRIYDISDPSNMKLLSTYDTAGEVANVAVSGSYAFVADKNDGIVALDISDPTAPKLVAVLSLDNSPFDIKVRGNRLYLAHGAEGLTVWDLVPKQAQTITFQPIPDRTVLAPAFPLSATASSGLPIQFTIVTGPATIANNILSVTGTGLVTVRASQPGDDQFGAVLVERSFDVVRAAQTIVIASISPKTTRSEPFKITATASSGLPVFVSIEGPAELDVNNFCTTTNAGIVKVTAHQAGNATYDPAGAELTFTVTELPRDPQNIVLPPIADMSTDDDPVTFYIYNSSELPLDVSLTGPAALANDVLTPTGVGTVHLVISQPGSRDYLPFNIERSFEIRTLADAATAFVRARKPNVSSADALPDADADHDGIPNIVEYILGSDPTSPTSAEGRTIASIFESSGAYYLRATYKKPRTTRYPTAVEIADWNQRPLVWRSLSPNFSDDGTGSILWPMTPGTFPLIRFVIAYP